MFYHSVSFAIVFARTYAMHTNVAHYLSRVWTILFNSLFSQWKCRRIQTKNKCDCYANKINKTRSHFHRVFSVLVFGFCIKSNTLLILFRFFFWFLWFISLFIIWFNISEWIHIISLCISRQIARIRVFMYSKIQNEINIEERIWIGRLVSTICDHIEEYCARWHR